MTSSRATLAALLALALVACGDGGSTGPGTGFPGSEQPGFNDQGPPGNDQAPVDTYDQPPSSGQQPGSSPGAPPTTGGSGNLCSRLCNELSARQCDVGDPATCASECSADLDAELGDCVDEFAAVFDCFLASPSFVCTTDGSEIDGDEFPECAPQALAYAECSGQLDPEDPDPPVQECTPDDGCAGCVEECDACLCVLDDTALCETSCQ